MNIKEVFKKYPENEPHFNGVNYLTLVKIGSDIFFNICFFNENAVFEVKNGDVIAFSECEPKLIFKNL